MIILSALVAQTGWQWMTERAGELAKVRWPRPTLDGLAVLALWIGGFLLAAAAVQYAARRRAAAPAARAMSAIDHAHEPAAQ